jgi:hypothetical protein
MIAVVAVVFLDQLLLVALPRDFEALMTIFLA